MSSDSELYDQRVFILGAGFSAGAGIPMMTTLLQKTMELFRAECPELFGRIDRHVPRLCETAASGYQDVNFPDLCTFLEYLALSEETGTGDSQAVKGLKCFLSKTVVQQTPAQPPPEYLEFAAQLGGRDVVYTFNWDGLLETALRAAGKPYRYVSEEGPGPVMVKLHGSVHWQHAGEAGPKQSRFDWIPVPHWFLDPPEMWFSGQLLDYASWRDADYRSPEFRPFVVLPGYGKAKDVPRIKPFWYKVGGHFPHADKVYIIGLSLSPDDFFARSFLLDSLGDWDRGPIVVINPADVRCVFDFLPAGNRVFVQERFGMSHVEQLAEDRTPYLD